MVTQTTAAPFGWSISRYRWSKPPLSTDPHRCHAKRLSPLCAALAMSLHSRAWELSNTLQTCTPSLPLLVHLPTALDSYGLEEGSSWLSASSSRCTNFGLWDGFKSLDP